MTENIISIQGLQKSYAPHHKKALMDIDLNIQQGEIFGLLGPNGAGKTTFFSILCGILPWSQGNITMHNTNLKTHLNDIQKIIGVVPQEIALYPTLSGYDNLLYIGRMYGFKGGELKDKVNHYLSLFGFDNNRHQAVKNYSGGMKRRINLIGGILHNPKILLLDEPTVGIDVQSRLSILEHLKSLNKTLNTTIIYTSHHLEQAEQFCDRVAILDEGTILKTDTPKNLIQQHNCKSLEEVFIQLTGKKIRD